jgi:hypothetical protein
VHEELLERQKLPRPARGKDVWKRRYREINEWERHLVDNGFRIVKLFLNVSKEEQRRRFLRRIDDRDRNWKFSSADVRERHYWDDYQKAFSQMLSNTSTAWAPWHVIPADRKWFMRLASAAVIVKALSDIDPRFPTVSEEERQALLEAKAELAAEAPDGAPAEAVEADQPAAVPTPGLRDVSETSQTQGRSEQGLPDQGQDRSGTTGVGDVSGTSQRQLP